MKKVIVFLSLLLITTTLKAQADFSFGPKIGYKANIISIDRGDFVLFPNGHVTFGAFGRIMIKDFVIQPELMYYYSVLDERSIRFNPSNIIHLTSNNRAANHSLALPIYFGYQFISRDNFNMRANIGPIVHFNFDSVYEDWSQMWDYKFLNLGAAFNLGVDIHRFTIDVSYSLGLTNVIKGGIKLHSMINLGQSRYCDSDKLNTFSVTLGYRFGK